MSGIWLLPTRGRRDLCQEAIDSFEGHMPDEIVVLQDGDGEAYSPALRLPEGWSFWHVPTRSYISGPMQHIYKEYPDADYYGWIADDLRIQEGHEDALYRLAEAAGADKLACTADDWMDKTKGNSLRSGALLAGALCWGGDLVRRVGWWGPPMVKQGYVDIIWSAIVTARQPKLHDYLEHVVVEHLNWRTGKRPRDAVDEVDGGYTVYPPHIEADIDAGKKWMKGDEFIAAVERAFA